MLYLLRKELTATTELIEKLLLTLLCSTSLLGRSFGFSVPVIAVLLIIILSSMIQVLDKKPLQYLPALAFTACCFFHPCFVFFLPVVAYDISRRRLYPIAAPALAAVIYQMYQTDDMQPLWIVLIFSAVSVMFERLSKRSTELERELITTRDDAVEYSNELMKKNKSLIEAQDNEVHLATLKERNRIAREIHDNVGHMLTRTILQMGAIQIINKDDTLKEPLDSIKTTLDDAMNSIRKSVHDLHDDSIDLESSLREAIAPLHESFKVHFDYDVPGHISGKEKYCFVAIVKEAVNNIIKHSSGDKVNIIMREHPAMCTLSVEDNGKCPEKIPSGGIGLENMNDRVRGLGGVLTVTSGKNGFKIFVSIMKKNRTDKK